MIFDQSPFGGLATKTLLPFNYHRDVTKKKSLKAIIYHPGSSPTSRTGRTMANRMMGQFLCLFIIIMNSIPRRTIPGNVVRNFSRTRYVVSSSFIVIVVPRLLLQPLHDTQFVGVISPGGCHYSLNPSIACPEFTLEHTLPLNHVLMHDMTPAIRSRKWQQHTVVGNRTCQEHVFQRILVFVV